jgi:hypothetical protein
MGGIHSSSQSRSVDELAMDDFATAFVPCGYMGLEHSDALKRALSAELGVDVETLPWFATRAAYSHPAVVTCVRRLGLDASWLGMGVEVLRVTPRQAWDAGVVDIFGLRFPRVDLAPPKELNDAIDALSVLGIIDDAAARKERLAALFAEVRIERDASFPK